MSESTPSPQPVNVQEYLERGDPYGWFDIVYANAEREVEKIPWANAARDLFDDWLAATNPQGKGQQALVVACGLGDDAEALAARGFDVTAFDVAPSAIEWCKSRYPASTVDYQAADLFKPPAAWLGTYDFVLEVFTVQALPIELRAESIAAISNFVAPGGTLLNICIGAEDPENRTGPPWPYTHQELALFPQNGLTAVKFDTLPPAGHLPAERWRVEYLKEG